jgi:tRNA nucleotidyltransferase (CCA-adding enzyme)
MDVITTHVNADFDSLASMLAAKKLYPEAVLVFPGSQEKSLRDFFLQSTFYVFETERIKNLNFKTIQRLILVDTRQPGRIGKFASLVGRPEVRLHIYDHHPASPEDLRGELEVIQEVGATVTILTELLRQRKIPISPEEATVMAIGLYEDTGSFTFSSTTVRDFETAGFLLSQGANLNTVANLITRELTPDQVSLLNELIQTATRHTVRGVEVVIAKASSEKYVGDFALLVHKLKDMENINVLFALAQMEDRVHLVARSRIEPVNVGEVASTFGGGGHATAASATIRNLSLDEVEENLLALLAKKVRPIQRARELMSFPVKSIPEQETIERARELLTRYNINVLPVMQNGSLAGLISRQIIEKAVFHGFKDSPVREYMTSEFATVHPRTPLSRIQDLIVGNNQRFLPVVEKGKLVGAITRTDLLRWVYLSSTRSPNILLKEEDGWTEPRKKWIFKMMAERLPQPILAILRKIGKMAEASGCQAYAVGGFVRDLILRKDNLDIDVVIEGDGIPLARALAQEEKCQLKIHKRFGTATLTFPAGYRLDLATARLEYYDSPAALPQVEHSSIKLDLYRRDFTVNALALHLQPDHFGELIDFFGGQRDLKERKIRVLHNLSFVEDPTRILRALRFEQRFGFLLAKHTHMLIENAARRRLLEQLSGKRLFREFVLCLAEDRAFGVVRRLEQYGLLQVFHPRLQADRSMEDRFQRLGEVLSWYRLLFIGEKFEKWLVAFLGLVHGLAEKEIQELLQRFSLPEKFQRHFLQARRTALEVMHRLSSASPRKRSDLYFLLRSLPTEFLLYSMGGSESRETKKAISLYFTELKRVRPSLRGQDLKRLGLVPGPIYTEIFHSILREKLDGKLASRQEELAFVQQRFRRAASPDGNGKEKRKRQPPAGARKGTQRPARKIARDS